MVDSNIFCLLVINLETVHIILKQQYIAKCCGRREMYYGHARLCVCLCVCLSAAACLHYCTDRDVTWGNGRGCPLVVHYWADWQSVYGLRCHGNITRTLVTSANAKC